MKFSRTRMLFIGMLVLSIIIFLQGKSFVPIACYFLIMAAIIEVMIVEIDQYKLKEMEIQNLKSKQADWIHKELNQVCESNDIEDIKKTLYSLDSKLYSSHYQNNIQKEELENSASIAQSKEWIEKEDIESNFERDKKEEFVEMQENKQQKYDTQNKIEEIKLQIDVLSDLSKKFPSKPDQFEKRIIDSYDTNLRIALNYAINALDVVQLFLDSPLKKMTSNRHDTVLNSISVNIKEIALHLSIYDSFYPLKEQFSLKDIISSLSQTLEFMENAETKGMLLTSNSIEANQYDCNDKGLQSNEKKDDRVKIIGDIEDFQHEIFEPDFFSQKAKVVLSNKEESNKAEIKVLGYIIRHVIQAHEQGVNVVAFKNSKYFKRQRSSFEYLVEHANEIEQSQKVLKVVVTTLYVAIYFKRK